MMAAPAVATGYGARLTIDLGALIRNWQAIDRVSADRLKVNYLDDDGRMRLEDDAESGDRELPQLPLTGVE